MGYRILLSDPARFELYTACNRNKTYVYTLLGRKQFLLPVTYYTLWGRKRTLLPVTYFLVLPVTYFA